MYKQIELITCTEAFAEENTESANNTSTKDTINSFIPLILIVAVFYFLVIRPQQKRAREQQRTLDSLSHGDEVVTTGGIIGTIVSVQDEEIVTIEIAKDIKVQCRRSCILDIMRKDEKTKDKKNEKTIDSNKNREK